MKCTAHWFGMPFTSSDHKMEQGLFLQARSSHWTYLLNQWR